MKQSERDEANNGHNVDDQDDVVKNDDAVAEIF